MMEWAITLHDKVIKKFTITDGSTLTIGRGSDADVFIDNTAISRKHTSLELNNGVYFLTDLKSLNGTFVNGKKIDSTVPVATTDTINIGKFRLIPVDMLDTDSSTASTVLSYDMDMEDETVFVSTKTAQKVKPTARESTVERTIDRAVKEKPKHSLIVVEGPGTPKQVSLDAKTSVKIGKTSSCDIIVSGWFVADTQCYIIQKEDKYVIVPQKGWVKNRLNGTQISEETVLHKGDLIEISKVKIRFD